ncbi:MAG: hypothetical protein ACJAYB_000386 [Psychromonas sp.]
MARNRVIAKYIAESYANVIYLFSGRDKNQYYEIEVFNDHLIHAGLIFVSKGGKVNYLKTGLKNNLGQFIKYIFH